MSVVIAAVALWSGYWLIGARTAREAVVEALSARRADGWRAEAEIGLAGYPNRFDLTLTEPRIAGPQRRFSWRAPFLQIFALSYRPDHVIAVWPRSQRLETPAGPLKITSRDLRASVVAAPGGGGIALDRARLVGSDLGFAAGGRRMDVGELRLALRRGDSSAARYEIGAQLERIRLPEAWLSGDGRPQGAARIRLDAVQVLAAPLTREALSGGPPQVEALEIREASLVWGAVDVAATGSLSVTPAGYPQGELTVSAENWRALVPLVEAAGVVGGDMADAIETGLVSLAQMADGPLEVPLVFEEGRTRLGPVPIGPAPRLAAQRQ